MKIKGWFRRNNLIMLQAQNLAKQLHEAWNEKDILEDYYMDEWEKSNSLTDQLHRVARERDQERKKRIDAEVAHLDSYLDRPSEEEIATIENYKLDNILAELDNEEE